MRKAILEKFIFVLLAALCINSVIFYIASRNTILDTTKKDMLYTMEILDQTLDYEGDLAGQVQRMENFTAGNPSRLTLIRTDGTVVSDSDADPAELDNHLSRKEVVQAMKKGSGFAERYSHTLKRNLLYVAYRSNRADMIIRVSVPYSGARRIPDHAPSGGSFQLPGGSCLCAGGFQTFRGLCDTAFKQYCSGNVKGKGRLQRRLYRTAF